MDFSHYSGRPVELAIALVNSKNGDRDALSDMTALHEFLDEHRDLWEGVARSPTNRDLAGVRRLRTALREVVTSSDNATAAARVNEILTRHGAEPRLSLHSGVPHLHFEPIGSSMVDFLGAVSAMALASVIVDHGVDRFGICNSSTCQDVFVDTSRNRSRLHCSSTCSTREAVAAFRRRQTG